MLSSHSKFMIDTDDGLPMHTWIRTVLWSPPNPFDPEVNYWFTAFPQFLGKVWARGMGSDCVKAEYYPEQFSLHVTTWHNCLDNCYLCRT